MDKKIKVSADVTPVGRFSYVEPMNLNLDLADNATVFNNEDYCIAVDLEVEIPSRIYGQESVKIYASSNNGTISFFGGTQTGKKDDNTQEEQGYLSTSWTDVSVSNNIHGNKETLGIESINISYTPNFFPVVNIKFIDVRGSSLFMPQQKSYEYTIAKNSKDLTEMDAGSFFKALFSLPSPIFKLTVKGFYGEPVMYKLLMSKSDFDFDSDNGNFVANVEFAGYMYGIYTDLPMSLIACAPYLDGKNYWNTRKSDVNGFKFEGGNGAEMLPIPEIIELLSTREEMLTQEVSQSPNGKKLKKVNELLELLYNIKSTLPFKIGDGINGFKKYKEEKVQYGNYRNRVSDGLAAVGNINNIVLSASTTYAAIESGLKNRDRNSYNENKQVYYQIINVPRLNLTSFNWDYFVSLGSDIRNYNYIPYSDVENCRKLIDSLSEKTDLNGKKTYTKYKIDFTEIIRDGFGIRGKGEKEEGYVYINSKKFKPIIPIYAVLFDYRETIDDTQVKRKTMGVDLVNLARDGQYLFKENKGTGFTETNIINTYPFFYKNPRINIRDKDELLTTDKFSDIAKYYGLSFQENSMYSLNRICTNIPDMLEDDIKSLEREKKNLEEKVTQEYTQKLNEVLGFNLTIENVYRLIFAHIETFMHHYYNVLERIENNEDRTNNLILYRNNIADVSDKLLNDGKVPPYPTIVKINGNDNSGKEVIYPKEIINGDIPETEFVENIVDAILKYGKKMQNVMQTIDSFRNANRDESLTYNSDFNIPLTISDMVLNSWKYNPYQYITETEKGLNNVTDNIWFTFIMRCLYFGIMFKKYSSSVWYNESVRTFIDKVCKYIGTIEACNLRKAFGDKISTQLRSIIQNSVNNKKFDDFLKGYFKNVNVYKRNGTSEKRYLIKENLINSPLFDGEASSFGYKQRIKSDKGNEYMVLPIKNFDTSIIANDINSEKGYPCLTKNDEYIVLRLSGDTILETTEKDTFNGKEYVLNKDSVKIIESDTLFFEKFINAIGSDKTYNSSCIDADLNIFKNDVLIPFYGEYLGSGVTTISEAKSSPYTFQSSTIDNGKVTDKIFYNNNSNTYDDFDAIVALNGKDISIKASNGKNISGFINNRAVGNTIRGIENGIIIGDNTYKFIREDASNKKILSAYLFLYTLPINLDYSYKSRFANMIRVTKTCLLREGAQYYWEDNFEEMKSSFVDNIKNNPNLTKNSIPVIETEDTKKNSSPTLYLTDSSDAKFLTWKISKKIQTGTEVYYTPEPEIPINRRETLKQYFIDWVNQYYSNLALETDEKGSLIEESMKEIIDLYGKEVIYIDYAEPLVRNMVAKKYPYDVYGEYYNDFIPKCYESFVDAFGILYTEDILENTYNNVENNLPYEVKLPIYQLLQTLYVKHLAGSRFDRWNFKHKDCDFKNFLYLDSFFNEIGNKFIVNGNQLLDIFQSITPNVSNIYDLGNSQYKDSVYEILSSICQKNGLTLIAMPINPLKNFTTFSGGTEESYDNEKVNNKCNTWELFNTLPYNAMRVSDTSCFLSLYTYKPSEHLDIEDVNGLNGYVNDTFNIIDNGNTDMPISLRDNSDALPKIPSFGVTYAKQNQSIFKKVNVGTSSHQVTEASIGMLLNVASQADKTPRNTPLFGQDIYNIFANYSYTSEVEMMGCAPICPFMYYQLNNIPLFKGAYQIFNVEHNITAGNMSTKFKGYRVNKHSIPLIKGIFINNEDDMMGNNSGNGGFQEQEMTEPSNNNISESNNLTNVNYSEEQLRDFKERIEKAFKDTFSCKNNLLNGEQKNLCARYTYNIAHAYMKGECKCDGGHGNAWDDMYYNNILKLGYRDEYTKQGLSYDDITNIIKTVTFYPGDVLIYMSEDKEGEIPVKRHTQIYIDKLHSSSDNDFSASKWASSVKNNYGSGFVYNSTEDKKRKWILRILRANPLQEGSN